MEEPNTNNDEDDHFFDALDDFPFYNCTDTDQSELSTSRSTISHLEPTKHEPHDSLKPQDSSESPSSVTLLRRRSLSQHNRHWISGDDTKDPNLDFPVSSETSRIHDTTSRERRYKICRDLRENERECEKSESTRVRVDSLQGLSSVSDQNKENSTVTTANDGRVDNSVAQFDESPSDFLVLLAGLVIKAIGFQIRLLISILTFPVWLLYHCYVFVIDPFQTIRRSREYLIGKVLKVWSVVCEYVSPFIYEWLKEHKSIWKLALRFGWGLLWAVYVCCILCGFLLSSFVVGGLMMRYVVEEPIQMKEDLNFDYTKNSPVAFVPIISCPGVSYGVDYKEKIEVGKRMIPLNHKLQVTVSLELPESDYNRNLGMFQVRVDFLSANGKALASSSHPCMLQFKSQPIRLLLTFLEIAPLVAGYLSESQTLNVNMRGFTEGDVPTSCLRVIIEQRAEFRPGAGIPEIYAASLILESELPLFKRITWYWKKTLFIWISMMLFMMELLFALVCCRSIIIPRVRTRDGSASNNTPQTNQPVQHS